MNATTSIRNRITAAATVAVGAGAIAIGALAFSAPASAATIQQVCEQSPGLYARRHPRRLQHPEARRRPRSDLQALRPQRQTARHLHQDGLRLLQDGHTRHPAAGSLGSLT